MVLVGALAIDELERPMADHQAARQAQSDNDREPDRLARLLEATAAGDRNAFAQIYQATASRLLGIAVKMLGQRDLAEEVLQETFLTVWQKAGQHNAELGSAIGWLTTILRHKAIDRMRSIGASPEIAVGADADLEEMTGSGAVTETDTGMVVGRAVLRCLKGIKETRREYILLAFYYGFTHEELADRTGMPLGTIKSDVRRGLADLRTCLER